MQSQLPYVHPFYAYISNYAKLTGEEWEQVAACITRREVSQGTMLLEEGHICRHLYFLESGLMRYFIWKEDGTDVTKYFTEAPYAFTSQKSFKDEQPATESIEALEDGVIWEMEMKDAYRLLQLPGWSNFVRELVQEVQYYTEEILEELKNLTAEARYRQMLETTPQLLQRVSLKHLASYLGIAPQSLSRIRNKIARIPSKLT